MIFVFQEGEVLGAVTSVGSSDHLLRGYCVQHRVERDGQHLDQGLLPSSRQVPAGDRALP